MSQKELWELLSDARHCLTGAHDDVVKALGYNSRPALRLRNRIDIINEYIEKKSELSKEGESK